MTEVRSFLRARGENLGNLRAPAIGEEGEQGCVKPEEPCVFSVLFHKNRKAAPSDFPAVHAPLFGRPIFNPPQTEPLSVLAVSVFCQATLPSLSAIRCSAESAVCGSIITPPRPGMRRCSFRGRRWPSRPFGSVRPFRRNRSSLPKSIDQSAFVCISFWSHAATPTCRSGCADRNDRNRRGDLRELFGETLCVSRHACSLSLSRNAFPEATSSSSDQFDAVTTESRSESVVGLNHAVVVGLEEPTDQFFAIACGFDFST